MKGTGRIDKGPGGSPRCDPCGNPRGKVAGTCLASPVHGVAASSTSS